MAYDTAVASSTRYKSPSGSTSPMPPMVKHAAAAGSDNAHEQEDVPDGSDELAGDDAQRAQRRVEQQREGVADTFSDDAGGGEDRGEEDEPGYEPVAEHAEDLPRLDPAEPDAPLARPAQDHQPAEHDDKDDRDDQRPPRAERADELALDDRVSRHDALRRGSVGRRGT